MAKVLSSLMIKAPDVKRSAAVSFRNSAGLAAALIGAALLTTPGAVWSADANSAPSPRTINLTPDSAKGWLPSETLEQQARKTAMDYLAARDAGHYVEAYGFLADIDQRDQSLDAYSDRLRQFNARAGTVKDRRITMLTWTKDPTQAPSRGVYAAIDLVSQFTNIDRHCGFLVLFQAPDGGPFHIMREEEYFLHNDTVLAIEKQGSAADVDKVWAQTAHCPNYPAPAPLLSSVKVPAPESLPEAPNSTMGYSTVAAALEDLHSRPGVVFTTKDGWTVAEDDAAKTFWSFPPPDHPAYPSAVKRRLVEKDGGVTMDMTILCQASKSACDDLVRAFQHLNAQMSAGLQAKQPAANGQ